MFVSVSRCPAAGQRVPKKINDIQALYGVILRIVTQPGYLYVMFYPGKIIIYDAICELEIWVCISENFQYVTILVCNLKERIPKFNVYSHI